MVIPNYRGAAAPTSPTHRNNPLTKKIRVKKSDTAPPVYKRQKKGGISSTLCDPRGIRTLDPLIKSQLLYQLS